ncbi:TBC1 domain family member 13 [Trichinella pseudospiralis]|uniref:TBC1 domain family member 13 n=1 Tax=Trichinella pseudospiralis TaxID=6337 RepID=A0A0V1F996_TRIPS|nr:TBC1 domain family member 13 [Trichinella pseudospiralis]
MLNHAFNCGLNCIFVVISAMEMLDDIDLNWTLQSDSSNFRILSFADFAKDSISTPQDSFNFNTVSSFFTDSDDSGVNFGDNDQSPFSLPHEIRGLHTPEPACASINVLPFENVSNQHRHSTTDLFAENLNGHVAEPSLQSAGNVNTHINPVIVLATAYPPSNNNQTTKRYLPLKPKSESPSVLPVDLSSYVTSLEAKISKLENENLLLKRENDALKNTVSNLLFEMENLKLELASRLESISTVTINQSPKRRKDAVFVAVLFLMFTFNLSPTYFSSFTGKNTGAFDEQLQLHLISSRLSDGNLKKRSHENFADRVNRTKREIFNHGEETASSYPCKSDSYLNKTETFRLTMELNRWANRHQYNKKSDKKQGEKSHVQRAKSRVKNRSTDAVFAFQHDKKSLKLKKMFRRLCPEMSFFQKITQYPCQAIVKNGALALSQRVLTSTLRAEHLRNHRSGANNLVEDCSKRGNDDYFTIEKGKETHWQVVERILFIYSKLNPGVKYVQGMNEIIGPIYFVFASDSQWQEHAEADTFFCFQNLMSEIKDNFIKTLDSSNVGIGWYISCLLSKASKKPILNFEDHQMRALYSLLQRVDPVLHQAMTEVQQLCPQYFAFRWLSLLLSQEFLLPDVIRLWDTLFSDCRRFEFLLYVCLAMLILVRNDILTNEFSVNVRMLQNYPPIDIVSVIKLASEIRAVMEDRHPCVQGKLNLPLPESKATKGDVYTKIHSHIEAEKQQHHIEHKMMKLTEEICSGCGNIIYDRYLLQVNQQLWHVNCLRCSSCAALLDKLPSCYLKEDKVFCKMCYQRIELTEVSFHRQFSVKCDRCNQVIQSNHWVRRARQYVYHLACFACDSCQRQLSTGEEFALQDSRVLCKQHYMELLEGDNGKVHHKQKTKRVRTTFTEEQLQILQANFQIDSNPDGQDLERIAQGTGLSKRVTQNSRARQKKCQGVKAKSNSSHPNQSSQDSYDESSPSGPVSEPVTSHSIRSSPSQEDFTDLQYITDANEANVSIETDHIHMNAMFDSIDSVSSSVTNSPC